MEKMFNFLVYHIFDQQGCVRSMLMVFLTMVSLIWKMKDTMKVVPPPQWMENRLMLPATPARYRLSIQYVCHQATSLEHPPHQHGRDR
jgi:hypothetical protein